MAPRNLSSSNVLELLDLIKRPVRNYSRFITILPLQGVFVVAV